MNNHKKMVTDVFTSLAKGHGELAETNFAEDFKSTVLSNSVDKKQFITAFTSLKKGVPDLEINVHDVEEADNKMHAFLNLSGTHSGEIPALIPGSKQLTPSGKKFKADNVEVEILLKDDRIREIKSVKTGKGVFNELFTQLTA
jgi:hypothetical protein